MRVHFISVGGSVMHQLAIDLHRLGYWVSGSDDEIREPSYSKLKEHGLLPTQLGWHPQSISTDLDLVILGMHAQTNNPELLAAQALQLKIVSFPEFIYEQSVYKKRVVVGGSFGKTSTTAMVMHVLKHQYFLFDYLVGATVEGFEQSVRISNSSLLIAEGDEYLSSAIDLRPKFHLLKPHIAVLTGIAWDHINVFPTFEVYQKQFETFIETIEPNGTLIYNENNPALVEVVKQVNRTDIKRIPYQFVAHRYETEQNLIAIQNEAAVVPIFGMHNMSNLQAAFEVCACLGVSAAQFLKSMETFRGAAKRLQEINTQQGLKAFIDFAHSPSKVAATVAAVAEKYKNRKIVVVYELHTYSSFNLNFLKLYKNSLTLADRAAVFYSQKTLSLKKQNLTPTNVLAAFNQKDMTVLNTQETLKIWIEKEVLSKPQAVFLFMTSGNFEGLNLPDFLSTLYTK